MHDFVCKQVSHYTTPPSTNSVIQVQKPAVIKVLSRLFNLSRPATLPSRLLLCMLAVVHSVKPFSTHHSPTTPWSRYPRVCSFPLVRKFPLPNCFSSSSVMHQYKPSESSAEYASKHLYILRYCNRSPEDTSVLCARAPASLPL